jgi:hypothetical protein
MFALESIPPKHRIMYTFTRHFPLACICTLRSCVFFAGIRDSVVVRSEVAEHH